MRIIAGEFRGRRLLPPESDATRPITDRVKQSLFDILAPMIPDAIVYDCFAGTGSMGLECLSRGAAGATFFESDRSAVSRLEKNIAMLGVDDRAGVIRADLFGWFDGRDGTTKHPSADLTFLDPPYRFLRERPNDLRRLAIQFQAHLKPGGTVIFRHDAGDQLELPELARTDVRTYGGMTLEFLQAS